MATRERWSAWVAVAVAVWVGAGQGRLLEAAQPRPNVVVILADDLGFSDIGCYGGEVQTPHLDSLAEGGLRFTQAYNTARCWPSRAALLTGFYAQAVGRDSLPEINGTALRGGGRSRRPAWSPLLAEMLSDAGYRCYHSGKWHVDGDPREQGFDRSLDALGRGQSNFFDHEGVREDGQPIQGGDDFYITDAIGEHAVRCLSDHAAGHADAPFFHYIAFTSPHFPLHAPQEVIDRYRDVYREGWEQARQARYDWLRGHGFVKSPLADVERDLGPPYAFDDVLPGIGPQEVNRPVEWASLTNEQQAFQSLKMAIHAAMVDVMDQQIGLVLAQLRDMNVLDNTLVIFASDNGASAEMMIRGEGHDPTAAPGSRKTFLCLGPGWSTTANTPFRRHKTWTHEGGIATPLIVHWPAGITTRGGLRQSMVHLIDITPTVLEVAGLKPPAEHGGVPMPPMQGRSFAETLADDRSIHEELWWCHEGHRAVRVGNHKLVAARGEPWELYDLANDRCETMNLASKMPGRVAELEAAWTRIAEECVLLATDPDPASAVQGTEDVNE
jgi:arylsulfatase A-like enzyme